MAGQENFSAIANTAATQPVEMRGPHGVHRPSPRPGAYPDPVMQRLGSGGNCALRFVGTDHCRRLDASDLEWLLRKAAFSVISIHLSLDRPPSAGLSRLTGPVLDVERRDEVLNIRTYDDSASLPVAASGAIWLVREAATSEYVVIFNHACRRVARLGALPESALAWTALLQWLRLVRPESQVSGVGCR